MLIGKRTYIAAADAPARAPGIKEISYDNTFR